jgi:ferredoxin, 2Fe-2S
MAKITFIDSDGVARTVEGSIGKSVMETALKNDVPDIIAECGGACACATCHVYVDPAWLDRLPPPDDTERSMLEFAAEPRPNSRLSCQIRVRDELDGLIVTTPDSQS